MWASKSELELQRMVLEVFWRKKKLKIRMNWLFIWWDLFIYPACVWDGRRVRSKEVSDTDDFLAPGCMCRWGVRGHCSESPF